MAIYAEDLKAEEEERRRITKALPAASEAREPEENRDE
jgi:hypothetical protein